MAGSFTAPVAWSWSLLLQRMGLTRGPRRRSPLAISGPLRAPHAEVFLSERTGDWIQVGCNCQLGYDHWHTSH